MDIKIIDRTIVEFEIQEIPILASIRQDKLRIEAGSQIEIEPNASNCIFIKPILKRGREDKKKTIRR